MSSSAFLLQAIKVVAGDILKLIYVDRQYSRAHKHPNNINECFQNWYQMLKMSRCQKCDPIAMPCKTLNPGPRSRKDVSYEYFNVGRACCALLTTLSTRARTSLNYRPLLSFGFGRCQPSRPQIYMTMQTNQGTNICTYYFPVCFWALNLINSYWIWVSEF